MFRPPRAFGCGYGGVAAGWGGCGGGGGGETRDMGYMYAMGRYSSLY